MSDFAVVAYEAGDADRAAKIVQALRTAGIEVRGDKAIGNPVDPEVATAIDRAWVVLALWSRTSTDRNSPQALFRAMEETAARGAYLGVILDGVPTPFGFGGLDQFDMARWAGGNDKALGQLVDKVQARLKGSHVGITGVEDEVDPDAGKNRTKLIAAGAVVLVLLAALGWFMFGPSHAATMRQQIDAKLFAIPCAWLAVDPVNDGSNGTLALKGVADQPDRAGETIRGLLRDGKMQMTVTTDEIAQIGSNECPAIDVPRRLRQDDGGQLRIESADVGRDKSMGLAEARVILNFRSSSKSMALFGMEPSGKVTWILPDRASLDALKSADVAFVHDSDSHYEFTLRADHIGWTGLLLVTGEQPLPTFEPATANGGDLPAADGRVFAQWLQSATNHGDWHTEMIWYRIQSR